MKRFCVALLVQLWKKSFHPFSVRLQTKNIFFFKQQNNRINIFSNAEYCMICCVTKCPYIRRIRIQPIRNGYRYLCKPAGYQNTLLGAVTHTDYTGGVDCLRRRLGSDCPTRFTRFTLVKAVFDALQPPAPASGEPAGKAKKPKTSSCTALVVRQTQRNMSVLLFQLRSEHFLFHVKL